MSLRKWALIAIVLFIAGLALGLWTPPAFSDLISREITELKRLGQSLSPSTITTFAFIFGRNAIALLGSFVLSPILLLPAAAIETYITPLLLR